MVTPSRSLSTSQLSGVWAARAEVLRPPLEPRTLTRADTSYPSSITDSASSRTGSFASTDSDAVKSQSRKQPTNLKGAWSVGGATGAQIVKKGGGKAMFQIGPDSRESSAEREGPSSHMPSRPSSSNIRGGGQAGHRGDLRSWSSGPSMRDRDQRSKK